MDVDSTGKGELADWLALILAPGVGPVRFQALVARFGSVRGVLRDAPAASDLPDALRAALRHPDEQALENNLAWAATPGCQIITLNDPHYPPLLAETAGPPPLLFVRGEAALLSELQLAMVGSRNPTPSGAETAHEFARHLTGAGLTITSGLAAGIDAAAHRGALAAPGPTIAVCGTGLERVYPARHRELAHAIVDSGGAIVSEFPIGTPPTAANFPRRNRIISGLSLGTLVVEAALRSGSLITARSAAEQGREVFAIPGSIHNPLARGCHRLIRQGAKLVETAADVLEELAPQLRAALDGLERPEPAPECAEGLPDDHRRLLAALDYSPASVDMLVERSGLTADAVSSILLLLELRGSVAAAPGGQYSRAK